MTLATALPDDLPWGKQQAFLLIDGTTRTDWLRHLKSLDPRASLVTLYDRPPFSALRDISPLLVQIEQPDAAIFRFYLQHAVEEWAVLVFSPEPAHDVARHLRQLLTVEVAPGQQSFLRLGDAAVARALFNGSDQRLFGPLTSVVTADSVGQSWCRQQPRLPERQELPVPYCLSAAQNAALDEVDRRRALLDLNAHLLCYFPDYQAGESSAQRWSVLERLEADAGALGLSSLSELLYYANVMAWLDGTPLDQHPEIARLLQTRSLQSPGERVVLAAHLAHRWATEGRRP